MSSSNSNGFDDESSSEAAEEDFFGLDGSSDWEDFFGLDGISDFVVDLEDWDGIRGVEPEEESKETWHLRHLHKKQNCRSVEK